MEVRPYEHNDDKKVFDLIQESKVEYDFDKYSLFFNDEMVALLMSKFANTSFVLADDKNIVGVMGGLVIIYPLNGERMYQEYIWYVNKMYRKYSMKLYNYLENYCRISKIKYIVMGHMNTLKAKSINRLYDKLGYQFMEKHYIKELR